MLTRLSLKVWIRTQGRREELLQKTRWSKTWKLIYYWTLDSHDYNDDQVRQLGSVVGNDGRRAATRGRESEKRWEPGLFCDHFGHHDYLDYYYYHLTWATVESLSGGDHWGWVVCHRWEPEAAGGVRGEGEEEGGEVPGQHNSRLTFPFYNQDQIKQLNIRLKQSDSRSEYAEMNISKLHHRSICTFICIRFQIFGELLHTIHNIFRIDELEDEIIREKLKINAVSGQLDDTFNEMLNKY